MIGEEYRTFFKELENHNTKEWFHGHKKEYEKHVKRTIPEFIE